MAYSSYASMIKKFWCHELRQVPCILGPCSKDLSVLYYVLYWDHLSLYGHMERKEILNPSSCKVGDHERVPIFMLYYSAHSKVYLIHVMNPKTYILFRDKALLWSTNTRGVNTHKDTFKFTFNSNISLFTVSIVNCILNCYPHFSVRIYCPNSIRPRHLC